MGKTGKWKAEADCTEAVQSASAFLEESETGRLLHYLKRTDIIYIIFQLRRPDRRAIIGLFVQPEEF